MDISYPYILAPLELEETIDQGEVLKDWGGVLLVVQSLVVAHCTCVCCKCFVHLCACAHVSLCVYVICACVHGFVRVSVCICTLQIIFWVSPTVSG